MGCIGGVGGLMQISCAFDVQVASQTEALGKTVDYVVPAVIAAPWQRSFGETPHCKVPNHNSLPTT